MGKTCSCLTQIDLLGENKDLSRLNPISNFNGINKTNIKNNKNINYNIFSPLISNNLSHFFKSNIGKKILKNKNNNKLFIILHKYFLKILIKKNYLKRKEKLKEYNKNLLKYCIHLFYIQNKNIQTLENTSKIKYNKLDYLNYYTINNEEIKNKYNYSPLNEKKIFFQNLLIIHYNLNNIFLNSKKENININNDKKSNLDNNMFNKIKNNIINNAISFYIGDLNINNIPNGYGILYEKSGYKKEGFFQNGIFTGWNNLYNNNNKIQQIGYFNNNEILNNYGYSYNLTNKIIYKGNFKNNLKEGEGEEKNNEYLYKGNFINDKKNGNGKIIYNYSGDIYEGNFKDDLFEGNGHYIYTQTGEEYIGEFKNGIINGKGLIKYNKFEYYKGDFENGIKQGKGEIFWKNGRKFIGDFINNLPYGKGIYDNGKDFYGEVEFKNGKLVKFIKKLKK